MENVNNVYFDGYYKEIWRSLIPSVLTPKEVEFIISYFNLGPGSKVLDLMCGYGRHALALAEKGVQVTAVDNLAEYIEELQQKSAEQQLPVKAIKADVGSFKTADVFDLVICMGNSLCFFNREDTITILRTAADQLRSGGHLLINSWTIAEIAFKNFQEKSWSYVNDARFLSESEFFLNPTRIETENTIIFRDGRTEVKKAVDYIYSIEEMKMIFTASGFELAEIFSIPGRKKFSLGDPRAYIVAKKSS